jgi:hypothetical protein
VRAGDSPPLYGSVHLNPVLVNSQAENAGSIPVTRSLVERLVRATTSLTSLLRVSGPSAIHPASARAECLQHSPIRGWERE